MKIKEIYKAMQELKLEPDQILNRNRGYVGDGRIEYTLKSKHILTIHTKTGRLAIGLEWPNPRERLADYHDQNAILQILEHWDYSQIYNCVSFLKETYMED